MLNYSSQDQVNVIRNKYASRQLNKYILKTPVKDYKVISNKQTTQYQDKTKPRKTNINVQKFDLNIQKIERTGRICKNKNNKNQQKQVKPTRQLYIGREKSLNARNQINRNIQDFKQNSSSLLKKGSQHISNQGVHRSFGLQFIQPALTVRQSIKNQIVKKLGIDSLQCIENVEKIQTKIKRILNQK